MMEHFTSFSAYVTRSEYACEKKVLHKSYFIALSGGVRTVGRSVLRFSSSFYEMNEPQKVWHWLVQKVSHFSGQKT